MLFNQAVQTILSSDEFQEVDLLLEVGPHSALAGPIKQIKAEVKAEKLEYVATLQRNGECATHLLKAAGELWLRGYPVDMERVTSAYAEEAPQKGKPAPKGSFIVDLPPYQWNYTRPFWAESRSSREQRLPKFPRHDVLGQLVIGSSLAEPTWRNVLRIRDLPWLKHHHLGGESVFPAAGYFAMAIEAIRQINELSATPSPSRATSSGMSPSRPPSSPPTMTMVSRCFSTPARPPTATAGGTGACRLSTASASRRSTWPVASP